MARFPPYLDSAAPEAFAVARRAGLILDDWQRGILTPGLGIGPDGDWAAKRVGVWVPRQNGKGGIIEALELYWLFVERVELVVHTAHQDRTSEGAFKRLRALIEGTPALAARMRPGRNRGFYEANGRRGLRLADGREMLYTTRSARLARGWSTPRLILDEAQALTGDQVAAIMPTLSAMAGWQAWFFGTPPDDPDAWCYGLRADGEAGMPRVGWADWGADLDLDDPAQRAHAMTDVDLRYATNPALGIRITEDTVADEARPSGLGAKFPAERLGVWPPKADEGSAHITAARWAQLAAPGTPRPAEVAMAVAVAHDRSTAAILAAGRMVDGRVLLSVVDSRPGTGWIAARAAVLAGRWDPLCWVVDEKAPEASMVRALRDDAGLVVPAKKDEFPRGHLALMGPAAAAEAWALLVDGADQGTVAHLDEAPLATALAAATTRPLAGGSVWAPRAGGDITHLRAATNALWGLHVLGPLVAAAESDYDLLDSIV